MMHVGQTSRRARDIVEFHQDINVVIIINDVQPGAALSSHQRMVIFEHHGITQNAKLPEIVGLPVRLRTHRLASSLRDQRLVIVYS